MLTEGFACLMRKQREEGVGDGGDYQPDGLRVLLVAVPSVAGGRLAQRSTPLRGRTLLVDVLPRRQSRRAAREVGGLVSGTGSTWWGVGLVMRRGPDAPMPGG
jgi:hypothetical protein